MKNIIETAIANPNFSTLVSAIQEADLVERLSDNGPFSVLAPNNEAFAKIPDASLKELLADKTKLTSVLTYHVLEGKVMASDLAKMTEAKTLEGSKINIDNKDGVEINDAKVLNTDIDCSNGVIHEIDTVLMPK